MALGTVIAVAITAFAVGSARKADNVKFCVAKSNSAVSLAKGGKCTKKQKPLTVAKKGPRGAPGADGQPGQDGSDANVTPGPITNVAPFSGPTSCQFNIATFCSAPAGCSGSWHARGGDYVPTGFYKDAEGTVHLRGAAEADGQGENCGITIDVIFILPAGFRPTSGTEQFAAVTTPACPATPTVKSVSIETNGYVRTSPGCVSLSGISFRP